ncbi:hypothetical protein GCM10020331_055830 [Ectobacillus funiculus]
MIHYKKSSYYIWKGFTMLNTEQINLETSFILIEPNTPLVELKKQDPTVPICRDYRGKTLYDYK